RGARRRCVHAIGRPGWRGRLPFWLRRANPTSLALDPLAPVKDVPSKNTLIGAFTPQVIGIGAVLRSDVARSGAIVHCTGQAPGTGGDRKAHREHAPGGPGDGERFARTRIP